MSLIYLEIEATLDTSDRLIELPNRNQTWDWTNMLDIRGDREIRRGREEFGSLEVFLSAFGM